MSELGETLQSEHGEHREPEIQSREGRFPSLFLHFPSLTLLQEARAQHPGEPARWIDSEVALDEAVRELEDLEPDQFPAVVAVGGHATLVSLMGHENADVGAAAAEVAAELLNQEENDGDEPLLEALAGELAEAGAVGGALSVWRRLAEEGAESGASGAVALLERLAELDPESAESLCVEPGMVGQCAQSLESDSIGLAASELLGTALLRGRETLEQRAEQETESSKEQRSVMEALLTILSRKGRGKGEARDARGREAVAGAGEAVAGLGSVGGGWSQAFEALEGPALGAALVVAGGAGLEAGVRLLAWTSEGRVSVCVAAVEAGVLGPLLMWLKSEKWPRRHEKRYARGQDEWTALQGHAISLLRNCAASLTPGSLPQLRVWHLLEAEQGAGMSRLVELWTRRRDALTSHALMPVFEKEKKDPSADDEQQEQEMLVARLEYGWASFVQLSEVLVWVACLPSPLRDSLRKHLSDSAKRHMLTWPQLAAVLQTHRLLTGYDLMPVLQELQGNVLAMH